MQCNSEIHRDSQFTNMYTVDRMALEKSGLKFEMHLYAKQLEFCCLNTKLVII